MPPRPEDQAAEDIGLGQRSPRHYYAHFGETSRPLICQEVYNDTYRKAGRDEKGKKSTVLFCNAVVPQP